MIPERLTRREAIKAFCYECNGYQWIIRDCKGDDCPLFPYRLGTEEVGIWEPIIAKLREAGFFRRSEAGKRRGLKAFGSKQKS